MIGGHQNITFNKRILNELGDVYCVYYVMVSLSVDIIDIKAITRI
jgi:hypothetical protein